jgi:uncharacterized 2Fe-2S/4Fe-4S cluster protein (DUF4445 family)
MGVTVDVPQGTLVSDAAHQAGILVDLPCGGKGTCGKCLVRISSGSVESKPATRLTGEETAAGFVLACRSSIREDVEIVVPERLSGSIQSSDDSIDLLNGHAVKIVDLTPLTRQVCVQAAGPGREDGLSDLDRLKMSLKPEFQDQDISCPLSVIRKTADELRVEDGKATLTVSAEHGKVRIIDIKSGRGGYRNLGIAVDLGTTTISVELMDLETGKAVSGRSGYNDQVHCGLDVISRINYASNPDRLEELRVHAVRSVNRLVREALEDAGAQKEEVTCCRISGNTVMTHLLLGLKPEYIRLEPYTPTVLEVPSFRAADLGLDILPDALVTLSPCIGSYVGGDITAGMLVTDLTQDREEICLFIDIGTNGEIVAGNKDFLMTCACSAGPAFEGGGIDCGMRATDGAIDHVSIDRGTGRAVYTTIGQGAPAGICGSGLIDLVAGLFLAGWLDSSGKFKRSDPGPFIRIDGRRAVYTVAEGKETASGRPITLSETDIENLIRAKAAIYAAASLLLGQAGITFQDLSAFYVAGGFGRFLDFGHAVALGLLPDIPREKFRYVGNASLQGSCLCLLSQGFREAQSRLAGRMTYIDLSTFPGYMDQYTAALFLPHTELHHFPGVMKKIPFPSR